jgi:hypothetical protein
MKKRAFCDPLLLFGWFKVGFEPLGSLDQLFRIGINANLFWPVGFGHLAM